MAPKAVKIIDIDSKGQSFKLNHSALEKVLTQVPPNMPVSIVSVVGAYRTGKSFLLDFFLRYLRSNAGNEPDMDFDEPPDMSWMEEGGDLDGAHAGGRKQRMAGFGWKHGDERCTTGIWIWNEFFIRRTPDTGKKTAVFLLDTQGMYDSDTGQHLTASIFGLGSLISSYTVYNLTTQIQEDNLQHLALFSEYGRVAVKEAGKSNKDMKAFQKLEFLVRDYRNLGLKPKTPIEDIDLEKLHDKMELYLQTKLEAKQQHDLQEVRDQINLCFEELSCYCLPHPGEEVAENEEYSGQIDDLRPQFKYLLADYCRRVFSEKLSIKQIQGHTVSAVELLEFVKVYCRLFQETEIFPEAKTLFRATQEANVMGAIAKAMAFYKMEMDAKISRGHLKEDKLMKVHAKSKKVALKEYAKSTKIGSASGNEQGEKKLKKQIKERFEEYKEANNLRNPFSFVAPYVIPLMIAFTAWAARYILETVCPRRNFTCLDVADFFGSIYLIIMTFVVVQMASTLYGVRQHLAVMFTVANGPGKSKLD